MAILTAIQEILEDSYLVADPTILSEEVSDQDGNLHIMQRPIIANPRLPYALYKFDTNPNLIFPYFKSGLELRRMCDYLLFAEWRGQDWCLSLELKKGKDKADMQLAAGDCFARFLVEAGERIGKELSLDSTAFRKIRVGENPQLRRQQRTEMPRYDVNRSLNLYREEIPLKYLLH